MELKKTFFAIMVLTIISSIGSAAASPYQIEFSGVYVDTKISFPSNNQSPSRKSTSTGAEATYFLQPVTANAGPLADRAFLSKSASVAGRFLKSEFDTPELASFNSDTIGFSARFVTQSDLIVELEYSKLEFDSNLAETDPNTTVGIGRYLDDRTTAIVSLNIPEEDVKIYAGHYRKLVSGVTQGVYMAYDFSLSYLDFPNDSGYQLGVGGSYYFSDYVSVSVAMDISKVGDFKETGLSFGGQYFFSESIYASVNYSKQDIGDDVESSLTGFHLGARF